jgi:NOL1/NOP2/sun family putative RNA methylase
MSRFLGEENPAFAAAMQRLPVHGLRVNTLKLSPEQFQAIAPFPLGKRVPWCDSAFLLEGEDRPGKHPYHLAGLYYLQDPSAMSAAELSGAQPGERVLDLAAAPGGKSTQLAAQMQGQGLLVANEIKTRRLNHLSVNLERWGAANAVITNDSPERLADHFGPFFDRVLVDAPCSGEGMFRKDRAARLDWSLEMVAGCSVRQGNILRLAAKLVRPGGALVYSTCTFAPEEDEGVIARLLRERPDFAVQALPQFPGALPGQPGWLQLTEADRDVPGGEALAGALRLFPHRVEGEGHFVCRLRREADGEPTPFEPDRLPGPDRVQAGLWQVFAGELLWVDIPRDRLRVRGERLYLAPAGLPNFGPLRLDQPGVWLGTFKKERFEPAHPLALFLKPSQARRALDLDSGSRQLAAYLRGETLPSQGSAGWILITVDGWPLGWGKRVQGVIKNHFPHGWQIYS